MTSTIELTRERPVPCVWCRRPTFHDDAVCGEPACRDAERRYLERRAS